MTKKGIGSELKILQAITPEDALAILGILAQDPEMTKRIEDVAKGFLAEVPVKEVAAQVQMELEFLDVEDVWSRAGRTKHGYVDTGDAAWEMFEEALRPFQKEVKKYLQLEMYEQARLYCVGILKGIYEFDQESTTEYKEWAVDAPHEFFASVLDEWSKRSGAKERKVMSQLIELNCPDWAQRAVRSLQSKRTP